MARKHDQYRWNDQTQSNLVFFDVGTVLLGVETCLDDGGETCAERKEEEVDSTYTTLGLENRIIDGDIPYIWKKGRTPDAVRCDRLGREPMTISTTLVRFW